MPPRYLGGARLNALSHSRAFPQVSAGPAVQYPCVMVSVEQGAEPITVLDLFAGCGGLTEGFHQFRPEGGVDAPVFRSVGAVEWEPAAAASYAMNFGRSSKRHEHFEPPEIFCRDITGWTPPWERGEVDVVVGGPPCQGFSGLNRLKVRAERNTLWQEFIRVVVVLQPKVFVIENVDRFIRSPEFTDLQDRIGNGDLKNYKLVSAPGAKDSDTEPQRARRYLLNAADYGAVQARRRAIVIGVRTDVDLGTDRMQYPAPTHGRDVLTHQAEIVGLDVPVGQRPWETVDALFADTDRLDLSFTDLPGGRTTTVPGLDGSFPGPFSTTDLHITRSPEAVSLARYRAIPPRGNRKDLQGRYLCRLDSGEEMIVEKVGRARDDDGDLLVLGAYKVVDGGHTLDRGASVVSYEVGRALHPIGAPRRGKAEFFRAQIRQEGTTHDATLEYLSTRAWDDHEAGSGDVMGRMRAGLPSVTIRTEFFKPEKGRYLHPTKDRPITHFEAARLQGFPDHFQWCGSKTEIAKQIGNAVPIPLGAKIAEAIYSYLRPSTPTSAAAARVSGVG